MNTAGQMIAQSIRENAHVVKRLGGVKFIVVYEDLLALAWISENHPTVLNDAYRATKGPTQ